MKARIPKNARTEKIDDNKNEKNMITAIKNLFSRFLDIMEKDGNLSKNKIKRMIEVSYSDDVYKIPNEFDIRTALANYSDTRKFVIDSLDQINSVAGYKKFVFDNFELLDVSRFVAAMFVEIAALEKNRTGLNYELLKNILINYPMKDLISYNLNLEAQDEEDEKKREKILKEEFHSSPVIAVYATTTSDEVYDNECDLKSIWNIEELIKVQKPEDVLEFGVTDEVKFKLAYINVLYPHVVYKTMPIWYNDELEKECVEIHREKEGYITEAAIIKAILTPSLISTDKLLLTSGFRALECLETNELPLSEEKLISMCIEIEKAIKDKKIQLSNKFTAEDFQRIVNSKSKIVQRKIDNNQLAEDELIALYLDGKTSYSILMKYVDKNKLVDIVSVEQVVEEYKKFNKNKKNNSDNFFRIAKLYRDNRIAYKNEQGDILDDEYTELKEKLFKYNGHKGIIDFYKMGIFDISSIISFDDNDLIKEAFLSGALSKSDISMLIDFEIVKEKELKTDIEKLPKTSLQRFLRANLEEINSNPKRKFIYALDPEVKSINAGDNCEIFFIDDFVIISDTLDENPNTGNETIILDKTIFEEEYGLGAINISKLFNVKADGEISINKLAKKFCSEYGLSFGYTQNWSDIITEVVVGSEEERNSRYSEADLVEQRKVIKQIKESLQK